MSDGELVPVVDRDECFGFGFCADALPEVFRIDETGHATVIGGTGDEARLRQAADDCPRGAIDLVRGPVPG